MDLGCLPSGIAPTGANRTLDGPVLRIAKPPRERRNEDETGENPVEQTTLRLGNAINFTTELHGSVIQIF